MKRFDEGVDKGSALSRGALYKIVFLSASIVGFSVSLFSIDVIAKHINIAVVQQAWKVFITTIILGFIILFSEGRIIYAKAWKGLQPQQHPRKNESTFKEYSMAVMVVLLTLIYPTNLLFNRPYNEEPEKTYKERVNGLVVRNLARINNFLPFLENFVVLLPGFKLLTQRVGELPHRAS
ncbi:MAG: hypothetical protein AAB549_01760, partial [Patescibacteria group bacterium]